jgi:hypothetical protein
VWLGAFRIGVVGLALVLPLAVHGKTWVVEHDPGRPEDLIGAVAEQAASGDTILVEPGTYYEHIPLDGKSLTLRGLGGPNQTILDGSRELPDREESIIYTTAGASGSLHVDGFTFQHGGGSPGEAPPGHVGNPQGGAINWWDLEGTATFNASNCRFLWNSGGDHGSPTGGAIHLQGMESSEITACYFEGNEAWSGGAIYLEGFPGIYSITDCQFVMHPLLIAFGDAVSCLAAEEIILRNNRFVSREAGEGMTLALGAVRTTVVGNVFEDHGGRHATWMRFEEVLGPPGYYHYDFVFRDNFLWRDSEPPGENETAILMRWERGTVEFTGNTIVNLSLVVTAHNGSIVSKNNILYKTRTWFHTTGGGEISCNDAWPDTLFTTPYGDYVMEGNLSADPLFCDEGIGDFRLAWESPCADANSPAGCGRVGLFEPACRQTTVRQTTWGRLKLQFQKNRR